MIVKHKDLLKTASLFIAALFIALFMKAYIVQPFVVDGQSMETTLQNNDRLIVYKIPRTIARITSHPYIPKRGDVIIFSQANLPGFTSDKELVKRVIGLPGDRVVIKDGSITIYNAANPKGFNPDVTSGYKIAATKTLGNIDVTLSQNQLFVCGDNRNHSEDSRFFGPINASQITGKLVLRMYPLSKVDVF